MGGPGYAPGKIFEATPSRTSGNAVLQSYAEKGRLIPNLFSSRFDDNEQHRNGTNQSRFEICDRINQSRFERYAGKS